MSRSGRRRRNARFCSDRPHTGFRFAFFSDEGPTREAAAPMVSASGNEAKIWFEPDIAVAGNSTG